MRVAKRFITLCRARIFLVCARYLSLASCSSCLLCFSSCLVCSSTSSLAEANLERPTAGTDASTRTAARRPRSDARAMRVLDACGLDTSAGSSRPFIRGRLSGSVMSGPIGRPRRGLKSHDEQLPGVSGTGSGRRTTRLERSLGSEIRRGSAHAHEVYGSHVPRESTALLRSGPSLSDATVVPLALPLGDGLAPGLQLPRPRCGVVVAEVLAERLAERGVVLERAQRRLERARQLGEVERVGVAVDRRGWRRLAPGSRPPRRPRSRRARGTGSRRRPACGIRTATARDAPRGSRARRTTGSRTPRSR